MTGPDEEAVQRDEGVEVLALGALAQPVAPEQQDVGLVLAGLAGQPGSQSSGLAAGRPVGAEESLVDTT